ncbi:MAG: 2-polyprenyl-3-methyl-5-hydroxy-6-metoxy-1,4-benzoquinol methylase [Parvicella sp.]|jgi:2-polyprenyl-3-methyl-5-hydroxy-6-metoxy-1,4-benzoquinol methylase
MNNLKSKNFIFRKNCYNCGSDIKQKYSDIQDKTFYSSGKWNLYECSSCKLIQLNPYPSEEIIGQYYETYYTHQQDKEFVDRSLQRLERLVFSYSLGYVNAVGRTYFDRLRYWLIPSGVVNIVEYSLFRVHKDWGSRILDVGCGDGSFLKKMKDLGWMVKGLDFDKKAADFAKKEFGINVQVGDLNDIDPKNEQYDVIVYSHVFEHLYDLKGELEKCYKLLDKNGRVVALTPNSDSLEHKLFAKNWRGLEPPRHIMIFNPRNLKEVAEQAGFKVQTMTTTARSARHLFGASMMILKNKKPTASGGGRGLMIAALSYLFQPIEYLLNLLSRNIGEEIYVVLSKD